MDTSDNTTTEAQQNDIALIEAAIAAAKGKKRGRKPLMTPEERAAAKAAIEAERAARKLAREAAKAQRPKRTPHLAKVEKAAASLPTLSEAAQKAFNDLTAGFGGHEVAAIAAHLNHHNRVQQTLRALQGAELTPGTRVRVVDGNPKLIGLEGTIDRAQRIRCYVAIPGRDKPVYLFTSDVEVVG